MGRAASALVEEMTLERIGHVRVTPDFAGIYDRQRLLPLAPPHEWAITVDIDFTLRKATAPGQNSSLLIRQAGHGTGRQGYEAKRRLCEHLAAHMFQQFLSAAPLERTGRVGQWLVVGRGLATWMKDEVTHEVTTLNMPATLHLQPADGDNKMVDTAVFPYEVQSGAAVFERYHCCAYCHRDRREGDWNAQPDAARPRTCHRVSLTLHTHR